MTTRRERRIQRAEAAIAGKPSYYHADFRRPCSMTHPLEALAWDQTEVWMTTREWLERIRRGGRAHKVYGHHTGGKWLWQSRPCIRAHRHPSSTSQRGWLPDSKHGLRFPRRPDLPSPVAKDQGKR